jgi:hypothetical protein
MIGGAEIHPLDIMRMVTGAANTDQDRAAAKTASDAPGLMSYEKAPVQAAFTLAAYLKRVADQLAGRLSADDTAVLDAAMDKLTGLNRAVQAMKIADASKQQLQALVNAATTALADAKTPADQAPTTGGEGDAQ